MRISLIWIGNTDQKEINSLNNQYLNKIERYCDFRIVEIMDQFKHMKLGAEELKKREGELLLKIIAKGDKVILLDEGGIMFSSKEFADKFLQKEMDANTKHLIFVIGGAFGFSEEVYSRADKKISLSAMTFTHQMVRLLFLEQLYRAHSILKGEKYHHE